MIEILAASCGAGVGAIAMLWKNNAHNSRVARDAMIRMSSSIEFIGEEIKALRIDMREDRHEIFGRLNALEQTVARLDERI